MAGQRMAQGCVEPYQAHSDARAWDAVEASMAIKIPEPTGCVFRNANICMQPISSIMLVGPVEHDADTFRVPKAGL